MNELTTKIMDMVNSGKCNKEICEELDIDYKTLYYELKKVKYLKRNYNKNADIEYSSNSVFCSKGQGFIVPWNEVEEYMHCEIVEE